MPEPKHTLQRSILEYACGKLNTLLLNTDPRRFQ